MRRRRFPSTPPDWWPAWQAAAAARLPPGSNPFGIVSTDGTLSSFVLPPGQWRGQNRAAQAQRLMPALARIQSAQPLTIDYVPQHNCTDLASGRILLDATVISPCPYWPQATFTERLDILAGLCVHEVLHLEHSVAELCRQAQEHGPLFTHLHNILEDEFIESLLPQTSPGYVGYLQAARAYMFGHAHATLVQEDVSLLNTVLLLVRAPSRVRWHQAGRYLEELTQISRILTPFPASGAAVYRATEQIYAIFQHSSHTGREPTAGLSQFLDVMAHPGPTADDTLERLAAAIMPSRSKGPVRLASGPASALTLQGDVTWESPHDHKAQYALDRAAVSPYIRRLRHWLQRWETPDATIAAGKARGHLDRRQLHTIPRGNACIFQRQATPGTRRLTIALLIDESGSMAGEKIAAARQVAVLFKEALSTVKEVELYIFGHSADTPQGTTNIFRYWAPGWKRRYSLGSIRARKNNRDGVALWAVAQDVTRRTTNRESMLLVMSDGGPHASGYAGEAAVEHTRSMVKKLQRDMVIIHIGIEPSDQSARMFDHHIRLTDLAALPMHMLRLLRSLLA